MPTADITGPDGKVYVLEAPEGTSETEIYAMARQLIGSTASARPPEQQGEPTGWEPQRLGRLVTEGIPKAAERFGEVMAEPSYAQSMMNTPLKHTPIPGAYDLLAKALRLPAAAISGLAELGPEQAKPLTETLLTMAMMKAKMPKFGRGKSTTVAPEATGAAAAPAETLPGSIASTPKVDTLLGGTTPMVDLGVETKMVKGPKPVQTKPGKFMTAKIEQQPNMIDLQTTEPAAPRITTGSMTGPAPEVAARASFPRVTKYKPVPSEPVAPTDFVSEPGVPTRQLSAWLKAKSKIGDLLPQDYKLWKLDPEHGAVTSFEDAKVTGDKIMEKLLSLKAGRRMDPEDWIKAEQFGYDAGRRAGGNLEVAISALPPDIAEAVRYMHSSRPAAKYYRQFLSRKVLTDEPLYLVPHIVKKDLDALISVTHGTQGLGTEWRTTLGAFEKPRTYNTMLEGRLKGVEYADPRLAMLYRTWADAKLIMTGKFVENLEKSGVLFRSMEAAKAAGKTGAQKLEGVPGIGEWYASSRPAAIFVRDQLNDPHVFGSLSRVNRFANAVFRNFNLWNPLPHYFKNMLYKYGFSGGNVRKVWSDQAEFFRKSNPEMLKLYEQYMPHMRSGRNAYDILLETEAQLKGLNTPQKFWRVITTPNRWSSRLVFGKLDPALKYARFKQYVDRGFAPQEAANQTHLDLIRYSTRSQAMDLWKSVPFNFFVPWRVGTMVSLVKNLRTSPLKAGLWVLGVDGLRELMYNSTGDWFHAPIDYFEGPVMKLVDAASKGGKEFSKEAAALALTIAGLGPGGESTVRMYRNLANMITDRTIDQRALENIFWGFALVGDPHTGYEQMLAYTKDHDPRHLLNVFNAATFAAHSALNYRPKRILQNVPISKTQRVIDAERLQDAQRMRKERRQLKFDIRQYPDIYERVTR